MDNDQDHPALASDWLRPPIEAEGAVRYLDTLRERWWMVALATILALAAAGAYIAVTPKRYSAEADLLVTAVPNSETAYAGLGLVTESNDPTQTVATAARLISTPAIAAAAARSLGLSESPSSLLEKVAVEPIADSSLIAVQASGTTAHGAQRLADGYSHAALQYQTEQLHNTIESQLPALRSRLEGQSAVERASGLGQRISDLEALLAAPYPSLRVTTTATEPTAPSSPHKKLALAAGLIGGLIIGLGIAFASQALDPRLRREEQLRQLFRLPLLAWIPRVPISKRAGPLTSRTLVPGAIEAYRTLRATLSATIGEGHRSILITSSSPSEGKTTTAINLAETLAIAGHRVLLIEGDLRRPTIAQAIGVHPEVGIDAVLVNDASMEDAITYVPQYGENLGFLIVARSSAPLADRLSLPTAKRLVSEAEALSDYVVIDSPPLTEVIDALPIAQEVDAVVIVARVGTSKLARLASLGNILKQGGVTPAGVVVVGREQAAENPYYLGRSDGGARGEPPHHDADSSLQRPVHGKST